MISLLIQEGKTEDVCFTPCLKMKPIQRMENIERAVELFFKCLHIAMMEWLFKTIFEMMLKHQF